MTALSDAPNPSPSAAADFELVIVSYHSRALIEKLLGRLPDDLSVLLVDNARGADGLGELARQRPETRYIDSGGGKGFAKAANIGVQHASRQYVIFGNPDSRPDWDAFERLLDVLRTEPSVGACAAATVDSDGRPELGGAGWEPSLARVAAHTVGLHLLAPPTGLFLRHVHGRPVDVDWVSGTCMAVRREEFLRIGGFDERYFIYSEDVALGRRYREAGQRVMLLTDLAVMHDGTGSGSPTVEMRRLRGASMASYLRHHNNAAVAISSRLLLALGYAGRGVIAGLRGQPGLRIEHFAYVRGLLCGAVPPS